MQHSTSAPTPQPRHCAQVHKFVWKVEQPKHREKMIDHILGKNFGAKSRETRSPFHLMENLLYAEIVNKRRNGHRVSNTFIRVRGIVLFKQMQEQGVPAYQITVFKASNGWRTNFIRRRNLKYRKRKCGKNKSANSHIPKFLEFLQRLRFNIIVPLPEDTSESIWGRFPPSKRYNLDQVPLPFVVSQEFTFTLQEDSNVHITCPNEALRKRCWTMHVVVNAGDGDDRHAWVDLVSKGTGKRIKAEEKARYDNTVDMYWQKNAWVDTKVMLELASKFVREKKRRHGDDWVVLYADNLSAHLAPQVKTIFGDNKVLIVYFPPGMTEIVQPIDAGYGRSLRAAIGRELDSWLMNAENLLRWEGKMTAMERMILVTHLVARAQKYMLSPNQDSSRVSCFERTGCLITATMSEKDNLIAPQGVTVPFVVPVLAPPESFRIEEEEIIEAQDETQEMRRMASIISDMEIEDDELLLDNDILNEITNEAEI